MLSPVVWSRTGKTGLRGDVRPRRFRTLHYGTAPRSVPRTGGPSQAVKCNLAGGRATWRRPDERRAKKEPPAGGTPPGRGLHLAGEREGSVSAPPCAAARSSVLFSLPPSFAVSGALRGSGRPPFPGTPVASSDLATVAAPAETGMPRSPWNRTACVSRRDARPPRRCRLPRDSPSRAGRPWRDSPPLVREACPASGISRDCRRVPCGPPPALHSRSAPLRHGPSKLSNRSAIGKLGGAANALPRRPKTPIRVAGQALLRVSRDFRRGAGGRRSAG